MCVSRFRDTYSKLQIVLVLREKGYREGRGRIEQSI
jgi:hypothetical protein